MQGEDGVGRPEEAHQVRGMERQRREWDPLFVSAILLMGASPHVFLWRP